MTDPDYRRLVTMKANYRVSGGEIGMRWRDGRFYATDSPATATAGANGIERMAAVSKAERVFLVQVERFNSERRNTSPSLGNNYAPYLFAKHPMSEGVTKRQFEVALDVLLAAGSISVEETGPASKRRKNIVLGSN